MKVILLAAITVDGYIGKTDDQKSTRWTSKEDTKFFVKLSKQCKNLVLGSKTFKTFDLKLTDRKFYVYSSKESIENPHDNEIEVVSESPKELVKRLDREGLECLLVSGGTSIYTQFMQAGVVDEMYLTVESVMFGSGKKLFDGEINQKISLVELIDLSDQTKVLHYKIVHK